ncbi:unnamed protein product [Cochlearia groenlandica]
MDKQYEKKITWRIKNFSSLQSEDIYSDHFVVGGCKWSLVAYPKWGTDANHFSLFLKVADSDSLHYGWRRHVKFRLTIVNQFSDKLSHKNETQQWFHQKSPNLGYSTLALTKLLDKNGGFLCNGEVKIVAELDVLEVIEKSDALEETSNVVKSIDVNGFQVLTSQAESVKRLFENYPTIATKFHLKNPQLRTTYLNVVISLNEILCESWEELSVGDLANAYSSLTCVAKAGFKVDWLEKKLKEFGNTRVQEIKQELKDLKVKCSNMDDLLQFLR